MLITFMAILIVPLPTISGQNAGKGISSSQSTLSIDARLRDGHAEDYNGAIVNSQLKQLPSLLNGDGTLDLHRGYSGSLNVDGWDMVSTGNGEPRFVRKSETQGQIVQAQPVITARKMTWDNRFARPGVDSVTASPILWSVAVSGDDVYVGGRFDQAGGAEAGNIARWDGVNWSPLGDGVNNEVRAIVVKGSDVYVGGGFTHAGSVDASGVAKWNGSSWSALGSGIPRVCFGCPVNVTCMVANGDDLYVGGVFNTAGGVPADKLAKWDGKTWVAAGNGLALAGSFAAVTTLDAVGGTVYAGGSFGLSRLDGTSWITVGTDLNGAVHDLAVIGGDIYVTGMFTLSGNPTPANLAKWDGVHWSVLGSAANNQVFSLAAVGSDLYAGGVFTSTGGPPVKSIAKWNGASWSPLSDDLRLDNDDVHQHVFGMASTGSDLYVVGDFILAGAQSANRIAKWNGAAWSVLGNGLDSSVAAILADGNDIYAGGGFYNAGGTLANKIARWDGSRWSALGKGMGRIDAINAMALSGGLLYAGGRISTAGEVNANNIAVWDGAKWSALGSGLGACTGTNCIPVEAIAVNGSDVYVGGNFGTAGGSPANSIARWNGTSWSALGSGVTGEVKALAFLGSDLYVGGVFRTAGGVSANNIARWNGSTWSAVGAGVEGLVFALAASGSTLYVGGGFKRAGGLAANNIAGWNGSSWFALGSGVDSTVGALAASSGSLYAGGIFNTAGGVSSRYIAQWNGSQWQALGGGVTFGSGVSAIALAGNDVFIGGSFNILGDKVSYCFARWFAPAVAPPRITSASVRGKKLFVLGENFDDGAVILLNGETQKTISDDDTPDSRLIGKKAGNKITPGDKLQVQNPNGLKSAEFTFTGE